MDTLGVCGAPSIAADNGVVMVKEPGLERVSENLDSLWTHTESLSDASEQLDRWTDGRMERKGWKADLGVRMSGGNTGEKSHFFFLIFLF